MRTDSLSLSTIQACAWEETWRVVLRRIRSALYEFAFGTNISLLQSRAVLTVYQTQHSAPFPADNVRSCTPTTTPARKVDAMEARGYEEPTIHFEDNKQISLFF